MSLSTPELYRETPSGGRTGTARREIRKAGMVRCGSEDLKVDMVDPLDGDSWDRLLAMHPAAGPFHSAAWARVLARTYGHRPCFLRMARNGIPVAMVPVMEVRSWISGRRGVCLPFSDCAGPLVSEQGEGEAVWESLAELTRERRWRYLEVRGGGTPAGIAEESAEGSAEGNMEAATFIGHRLRLHHDLDGLFARLSPAARRAVRLARRRGLTTRISTSENSMQQFVHLHERTRKRHGAPPQPPAFFRAIHEDMIAAGFGFVVVVEDGDHPVAAAVFLRFGTSAVYKFGASDPAAWSARPNNLAMWEAIRTLAESGCRLLDFGRTDPGQSGLERFKRSWGAVEEPITYTRFTPRTGGWAAVPPSGSGRSAPFFQRLPLSLNRLAGRLAYPHLD